MFEQLSPPASFCLTTTMTRIGIHSQIPIVIYSHEVQLYNIATCPSSHGLKLLELRHIFVSFLMFFKYASLREFGIVKGTFRPIVRMPWQKHSRFVYLQNVTMYCVMQIYKVRKLY